MLLFSQSDCCLATQDKTNNKYCQKKRKKTYPRAVRINAKGKSIILRYSDKNKSSQTPFNFKQSLGLIYKMFKITCQIFELYTMKYYNKI